MAEAPDARPPADRSAIQAALERQTRTALLRRLGPLPAGGLPFGRPIGWDSARGIGFAVDLVRAICAGHKTQTRRLIRPQTTDAPPPTNCPTARPGEVLYVREPWLSEGDVTLYAVDEPPGSTRRFKPAMYMPRRLARLWLRVTWVRVERLQAITAADLAAEGLPPGQSMPAVWDHFYTGPGERHADNPWVWAIGFEVETNV